MIEKSEPVTVTKKVSKSGRNSLAITISPEIVDLLSLDASTVVEVTLRKISPTRIRLSKVVGA